MARRSTDQPSGLSREAILAAATAVVRDEGIEALSMRRLAQELDVWPMSVYRYFQDKDALLDAVAAAAVTPSVSADGPLEPLAWRARIERLLADAVRSIRATPGLATRLPRAMLAPDALRLPEEGLAILLDAGLSPPEAASAWRALWSYAYGFAALHAESARAVRAAVAGLPERDHAALTVAGDELAAALADDGEFELGLGRLLDGIERALPAASR